MGKKKIVRPKYVAKVNRKKEPMSAKLKIGLWAGGGLLVLALLLFLLLYNDGSLPLRDNQIANKEDTWIISKLQVARGDKYYKLGEVSEPLEGFVLDPDMTIKSDANETSFWYKPTNTECQVESYYISGVSASVAEMTESLPAQFAIYTPQSTISEVNTAIVAGREASYFIVSEPAPEIEPAADESDQVSVVDEQIESSEDANQENAAEVTENTAESQTEPAADTVEEAQHASQQIICYIPAVRNASILISLNIIVTDDMPEWTEEQLVEYLQGIGEKVTVATL